MSVACPECGPSPAVIQVARELAECHECGWSFDWSEEDEGWVPAGLNSDLKPVMVKSEEYVNRCEKVLQDYVREQADSFGLKDWKIKVFLADPEPCNAEAYEVRGFGGVSASCQMDYGDQSARLIFSRASFLNYSNELQVESIAHELAHVLMSRLTHLQLTTFGQVLSAHLAHLVVDLITSQLDEAIEGAAYNFDKILARLMPPIEWPEEEND